MKKQIVCVCLAVVMGVVALTYSNHFHNALHFDDAHTIENNAYIQNIHNIPLFFTDGTTSSSLPSNQSYRPLLTTTVAIDYHFSRGGSTTLPYHITSFTFFILLGILMFVLFSRILRLVSDDPYTDFVALFAVAWFMLHPVCAETINYVIQRGDSLSTFFVVLGLTLYVVSPVCRRFFLYLIPVALGILTKPSALMFAPLLFVYIILFESGVGFASFFTNKNKALTKAITGTIAAFVVCILGFAVVAHMQPATYQQGGGSPWLYRLTQPFILFYYVTAWFAPIKLNADTDWFAFTSAVDPYAILGYAFFAFAVLVTFITSEYKTTRPIAFGLAWFFLAAAPTSLTPFSEITNDHRMFFPFVGLSLAIVWALYLLVVLVARSFTVTPVIRYGFYAFLAVLLLGYAYGTHERNKVWKTDDTLWYDCTLKSPTNGRGLMNYGLALMRKGDLTGAERYFSTGLSNWPYYSYLHVNMAILKDAMGKKEEAEQYFKSGIQYGSKFYPNCYFYYARFLNTQGRRPEAIKLLYTAMSMSNAQIDSRYLLMDLLYADKRFEELKQQATATLAIAPNDRKATEYLKLAASGKSQLDVTRETAEANKTPENYLNLSLQYYNAGDYQNCIDAARKALELRPNYAPAYNNIGSACNILKQYKEAREALLKAVELDPASQLAKNNLAVAEKGLKEQNK